MEKGMLASEINKTQVVMMVGGEGKRMGLKIPKALIKLGDSTLLDRCVSLFAKNGFRNFVFAAGYQDKEVTSHIENAGWRNLQIVKAYDYAKGIGKGKAFKHALMQGKIDRTRRSLMVWPDDVFVDPKLPARVLGEHLAAVRKFHVLVSDVVEKAYRFPMGVVRADKRGLVMRFDEKPLIPLLVSTGMRIFEPGSYRYFMDMIDLKKEGSVEFENAVLPTLARKKKVYAVRIPSDSWVQINTQKELEQAQKLVANGALPRK